MSERGNSQENEPSFNEIRVIIPSARSSKFIIVDLRQSNESQPLFKVEDWRNSLTIDNEPEYYRQIDSASPKTHAYSMLGELASKMASKIRPELPAPTEVSFKVEGGLLDLRPFPDEAWNILLDELCKSFDGKMIYQTIREILDQDRKEYIDQLYEGKDGPIFMNVWRKY